MTFLSYTDTRRQLRSALNTAADGVPIGISRRDSRVVLVDLKLFQELLTACPQVGRPEAVAEEGGWSVLLPGTPIAAEGDDLDEAVEEFIVALREYAEDWIARLRNAPNHADNWPLVQLVRLSTDETLLDWVCGNDR
ncbi:prevent-host-death protein [Candidatus Poriferisodalis sp.]|uniref:prevent-host-death protein n=1 Tax=Candidatus Poriferisodalis sp. TaxID=3101277 RepID=UPI003B011257